ncbi:MAG: sulfur carrier protein ThiS [bacterium]
MEKIKIYLNGNDKEIDKDSTVEQVVSTFDMKNPMFVVELNLNIVQKNEYSATTLKDGDKLEVVTFFGGG